MANNALWSLKKKFFLFPDAKNTTAFSNTACVLPMDKIRAEQNKLSEGEWPVNTPNLKLANKPNFSAQNLLPQIACPRCHLEPMCISAYCFPAQTGLPLAYWQAHFLRNILDLV